MKSKVLLIIVLLAFVTTGCGSLAKMQDTKAQAPVAQVVPQALVYVSGFVGLPGTYTVPVGTFVEDVVKLAGGFLPEADVAKVDVKDVILGTTQLYVPKVGEPDRNQNQAARPSALQQGATAKPRAEGVQPRVIRPQSAGDSLERQMVDLVNQERAKNGLSPLSVDSRLVRVARLKSSDMVEKSYFGHVSPTYGSPSEMLVTQGIPYRYMGENLAGAPSVQEMHRLLMESPGHRRNILREEFRKIGIGIVTSEKHGLIATQLFLTE